MFLGIACATVGMVEKTREQLEVIDKLEEESGKVSFARAALLADPRFIALQDSINVIIK